MRKLMLTGIVAVAGVLAFSADAQAFGKRKKNKGGCNSCASAAPVSTGCGGCGVADAGGPGGYAMGPEAMPATGTATVTQPGVVVPTSGTIDGTVAPAGGYYLQDGRYVTPASGFDQRGQYGYQGGYGTFGNGFNSGVTQGAFGTPNYTPYGSTMQGSYGNSVGRQVGRSIFRR